MPPVNSDKLKRIVAEVRDNEDRLLRCRVPHDFHAPNGVHAEWVCRKCGGFVHQDQADWYNRGIADRDSEGNR